MSAHSGAGDGEQGDGRAISCGVHGFGCATKLCLVCRVVTVGLRQAGFLNLASAIDQTRLSPSHPRLEMCNWKQTLKARKESKC